MTDNIPTDGTRGRLSLSAKREADDGAPKLEERLHKVLAQAGLGSRRALEERISHGLVKVNGEVAIVGQSVSSGDRIELDGKAFVASTLNEPARVLLYNKPEGEVTTREDPEGRPTVFEALPRIKGARWIAVGRLDINTTGLLLLTTDGELANALMHPSRAIEREYVCRVHGEVPDNIVDRLARGVALDDGPAKFDEIERIGSSDSHAWFKLVVKEGRNREVRRLWESQGFQVSRLKRVRYGNIPLPRLLLRGQSDDLPAEQVAALQAELGMEGGTQVLTLQPVIGQRKARAEIHVPRGDRKGNAYVNGAMADEARELRRFDHVREDSRPPRRGAGRPGGARPGQARAGKPRFGGAPGGGPGRPMGMGQHAGGERPQRGDQQPTSHEHGFARPAGGGFRGRPDPNSPRAARPQGARPGGFARPGGPRPDGAGPGGRRPGGAHTGGPRPSGPRPGGAGPRGPRPEGGGQPQGNPNAFRSWYVPEGVDTGSKQAPPRGPSARRGPPRGGPGGPSFPSDHAYGHERGPQAPGGNHRGSPNSGGPSRGFPSGPNAGRPGNSRPGGPRPPGPGGPRNAGPGGRPAGPRPDGPRPPNRGPRPGGSRGPRGGQA